MQNSQSLRAGVGLGLSLVAVVFSNATASEWLYLFVGAIIGVLVLVNILSGLDSCSKGAGEPLPLVEDGITYTAAESVDLPQAISARPYTDWLATVDRSSFNIRSVHFQSLDMFGPTKVGFVKFKADVVDAQGRFIPGIVLARGGAVAMLLVLVCEGREYAVLTVQPRFASGDCDFVEVCAGMLDGSGDISEVALKELYEELGIVATKDEMVNLTQLAGFEKGIMVSPGVCDEFIHFFAFCRHVSRAEMEEMNGRINGVEEEGEQIILKIVPLESLQSVADAKTLIIYSFFQRLRHHVPGALVNDMPFDRCGGEYHGLASPLAPVGKSVFFDNH